MMEQVYCDIVPSDTSALYDEQFDAADLLPDVQNRYEELDEQNLIKWIHTFGRSGPVAEYEGVFGTLKVTSRISCRAAQPSDLGRFASVIASIDFTIYTPWVAFELLGSDMEPEASGNG